MWKKVLTFVKTFITMTDKEKIELIIQDKHLNNTQFCNEVCIAPGTLSHIRSGRTEPTLNILRSIAQAFPDINPAWLFYGEGSMYKDTDSPTLDDEQLSDSRSTGVGTRINNIDEAEAIHDAQLNLFAFPGNTPSSYPSSSTKNANASHVNQPAVSATSSGASRPTSHPNALTSPLSVQEIVAETLKQQQKPSRKVVEVRIFFDDGTFETFSAK